MAEPKIQIGDWVLSEAQVMSVRVAIQSFQMECVSEEGKENLGPIADAYNARLCEVIRIMLDQGLT
jgi:hypothetical protein